MVRLRDSHEQQETPRRWRADGWHSLFLRMGRSPQWRKSKESAYAQAGRGSALRLHVLQCVLCSWPWRSHCPEIQPHLYLRKNRMVATDASALWGRIWKAPWSHSLDLKQTPSTRDPHASPMASTGSSEQTPEKHESELCGFRSEVVLGTSAIIAASTRWHERASDFVSVIIMDIVFMDVSNAERS